MRKGLIWVVALTGAIVVLSWGSVQAQRIMKQDDEPGGAVAHHDDSGTVSAEVQLIEGTVSVRNFPLTVTVQGTVDVGNLPATQNVNGTVEVSNLPATQEVIGTVEVSNLPLDADGNLMVSGTLSVAAAQVRLIGFTLPRTDKEILLASRTCDLEFPETRACSLSDLYRMIPPPEEWIGAPLFFKVTETSATSVCLMPDGNATACGITNPIACCGF